MDMQRHCENQIIDLCGERFAKTVSAKSNCSRILDIWTGHLWSLCSMLRSMLRMWIVQREC